MNFVIKKDGNFLTPEESTTWKITKAIRFSTEQEAYNYLDCICSAYSSDTEFGKFVNEAEVHSV